MAEELIKAGSNLNKASAFTTSYLRSVAVFGDEQMIRLFMDTRPAIDVDPKDPQGCTAQCRMKERLLSMGPSDPRKDRIAAAFEQLVDICSTEYRRAHDPKWQISEFEVDPFDEEEIFHDALEG